MEIKYCLNNETLHIFFIGELDEYAASYARGKLDDLIDSVFVKSVVYEFKSLTFTDSTGIGLLLGRYKKLKKKGVNVYIREPRPNIEKVLTTSGLFTIMPKIG